MDKNCIFCKIANKEIPSNCVLETDKIMAFHDVNPQAPVHVLIVPKKHYKSLNELDNPELMSDLIKGVKEVAKKLNIEDGYRTVLNTGKKSGQEVEHLHFHILAGRPLNWPPG